MVKKLASAVFLAALLPLHLVAPVHAQPIVTEPDRLVFEYCVLDDGDQATGRHLERLEITGISNVPFPQNYYSAYNSWARAQIERLFPKTNEKPNRIAAGPAMFCQHPQVVPTHHFSDHDGRFF